ncbi:outer membrane transport energization protein ExbB [Balneicella halophila]|uniref:Outer membrane transport energization protein ExbB n=1 Tax=Balneicella halophila TaxID=1537566 RepID=A0A7L4UQC7_BALHA|nr:MotA/TolQ/ExbB proton channel family protein [Balneicella halophila]PVX51988.1 outer membrane transport energization protein ExbB [Balneicella halophila]
MKQSFLEFVTGGSWSGNLLMLVLFALSIVAVYIFAERIIILQKTKKEIQSFVKNMHGLISNNKLNESMDLVQNHDSIAAIVLRKSLQTIGKRDIGINEANLVIDTIGNNEITQLEKGFSMLASIAGGAPMIGFLGTVIGMVQAFYEMSAQEGGSFEVAALSQGIYTAMFTTVGGLAVGIIAYFAYNYLISRLKRITIALEAVKIDYIELRNHQ